MDKKAYKIYIDSFGVVGNLYKEWSYLCRIIDDKKDKVKDILFESKVKIIDGHFLLYAREQNSFIANGVFGVEDIENPELADNRIYQKVTENINYLKGLSKGLSQMEVVDRTERGKKNQLEIALE